MRSILYYITGHGYGHAVRSNQVMRALQKSAADVQIHVRTTAPDWLFAGLPRPVVLTRQSVDVGVIQPDSLRMDLGGTLVACRALHHRLPLLIEQEVAFVREQKIDIIVGDIPPVSFEVAARASIPAVAITNFTWDVIYRAYVAEYPEFTPLIEQMTHMYAKATLALSLPYPCEMGMFPRREEIPWIARRSSLTRSEARAAFGLPPSAIIVLLSFGGIGLDTLPVERLNELTEFHFVATGVGKSQSNFQVFEGAQRRYEDLLRAVDIVVTKPGYGIVADVLAHQVPILYTDRGEFAEYPFLAQALIDLATAEFIPQKALRSGDLRRYLTSLLAKELHWPWTPLDGAQRAAENILKLLETSGRQLATP